MKHGHQGRVKYWQHGPSMFCIYRTLIQQRLLVEFSCEFPHHTSFEVYSLVRSFVLCDKWLPQQQNSTILWDFALRGLLFFLTLLPSSTESRELNVKKKPKPDPRRKGGYQLGRQSLAGHLHTCYMCTSVVLPCVDVVDSVIRIEGLCYWSHCDQSTQSSGVVH